MDPVEDASDSREGDPFGGGAGPDRSAAKARRADSRSSLAELPRLDDSAAEDPPALLVPDEKLSILPKMDHLFLAVVSTGPGGESLLCSVGTGAGVVVLVSGLLKALVMVSKPV